MFPEFVNIQLFGVAKMYHSALSKVDVSAYTEGEYRSRTVIRRDVFSSPLSVLFWNVLLTFVLHTSGFQECDKSGSPTPFTLPVFLSSMSVI